MLRVKWDDRLAAGPDGLLRWQGHLAPFSGLAYKLDARGRLASITAIDAGRPMGERHDWIDMPDGGQRVDTDMLDPGEGYGPFLLDGTPFSGVAYLFEASGACTLEALYESGFPTETSQRGWYESGRLASFIDPGGEVSNWFEDGALQHRTMGADLRYNIVVRDNGRVGALYVADHHVFDLEVVQRRPFDDEVLLIGAAVDTSLVAALTGLGQQVRTLRLIRSGVGPEGLGVLASLRTVRTLALADNPGLGLREAAQLAASRTDWTVSLDGAQVMPARP